MNTLYFEETNLNPSGERKLTATHTAVNAVAIATNTSWQEVVKNLIEQAHIRSNMPSYSTCITDMIKAYGFKKTDSYLYVKDLVEKINGQKETSKYIIKLRYSGYFAMLPIDSNSYAVKGITNSSTNISNRFIEEVWAFYPGTDNRTGFYRTTNKRSMPEDHKGFKAKNLNPKNKYIGDCVIRALSAAYNDCSWDAAMDHLAEASNYCEPIINSTPNINLTLNKLGFEHYKKIYRNNKMLTGKEFCELMSHTYFKGEKIFAYVGSSHCAAILPVKQDNGTYIYKIQDTWDSTTRKIGDYWVYKGEKKVHHPNLTFNNLKLNEKISHPTFGEGKVINIILSGNSKILEVNFNSYGIKKISEEWLQRNVLKQRTITP